MRASSDSQCPVPAQDRVMIVPSTASLDMRFQVDEAIPLSISRQCIVLISSSPGQFFPPRNFGSRHPMSMVFECLSWLPLPRRPRFSSWIAIEVELFTRYWRARSYYNSMSGASTPINWCITRGLCSRIRFWNWGWKRDVVGEVGQREKGSQYVDAMASI